MTTCETLTHGTCVFLSQRHRFGTDAMLLADFCRPRRAEFAADLCGGCGIVALRWHDEGHRGTCVSVELNGEAHGLLAAALAAQPEAAQHIKAVHADLRTYAPAQAGQFHLAACNPPYFTGGHASPDPARAAARHEETCAFEDAAACAARLLRDGGRFAVCHRPQQLARVLAALTAARLEPKRLQFVRHHPGANVSLVLIEARLGAKPGLTLANDLLFYSETGEKTADYKRLYHEEI